MNSLHLPEQPDDRGLDVQKQDGVLKQLWHAFRRAGHEMNDPKDQTWVADGFAAQKQEVLGCMAFPRALARLVLGICDLSAQRLGSAVVQGILAAGLEHHVASHVEQKAGSTVTLTVEPSPGTAYTSARQAQLAAFKVCTAQCICNSDKARIARCIGLYQVFAHIGSS